ncbi:MAG: hypothetical protein M1820_009084 [Bogoriella megaspora]|nr:MAG: hypothetical protein M1820_009084 [Bogoriella megaspora]
MAPVTRRQAAMASGIDTHGVRAQAIAPSSFRQGTKFGDHELQPAAPIYEIDRAIGIPVYEIDLSLAPRERYKPLARRFQAEMRRLTRVLDELLESDLFLHKWAIVAIKKAGKVLLRQVYSNEETEELRGICDITGVDMYLLVIFNVLLDCLMGCTSGAVKAQEQKESASMMHFRTLDWGMDDLRKVVVQLNFVAKPDGDVIASSITYAGFVGVLTGVRRDLSMSLNFRPNHNNSTSIFSNARYLLHCAMVLFGRQPSISHVLRNYLIPPYAGPRGHTESKETSHPTLATVIRDLPQIPTTACYLTFSDGIQTFVLEKDRTTAEIRSSESFITITNHDVSSEQQITSNSSSHSQQDTSPNPIGYVAGWIAESTDRRTCLERLWDDAKDKAARKLLRGELGDIAIKVRVVKEWMRKWPISNECTHFWCLMDPKTGTVRYAEMYEEPIEEPEKMDG